MHAIKHYFSLSAATLKQWKMHLFGATEYCDFWNALNGNFVFDFMAYCYRPASWGND